VPEIYNGKNIADYVDPDIWEKLAQIEREEEMLVGMEGMKLEEEEPDNKDLLKAYKTIQSKKHAFRT
jgi:nucleolar GTP-binding protein